MAPRRAFGTVLALGLLGAAGAAEAGLEFCNDTEDFQSVAIGYFNGDDWTSEGWWLIEPGGCAEPLPGDLQWRYYYFRAVVDGGEFDGEETFCTEPFAFTILGAADCDSRGYDTAGFREIDTGETAVHHVERIVATTVPVPVPPMSDDDMPIDDMPDFDEEPVADDDLFPDEDDFDMAEDEDFDDFDFDDTGEDMPNMRRGSSRL